MKQHDEILEKYSFKKDKPFFTAHNYSVWQGTQKQTSVPVTIKLLKYPHIELPKYLKKLKEVKSQFIVKIFELSVEQTSILMVTEQVTYGTLKKALAVCQHLDENDSVFISRALLNGHVDMLRDDCNWFGTEDDIEFTDTGIKLSWNNSCQFNLANPFPTILSRLVTRTEAIKRNSLLPFPEVKIVNELIKVSKENASEISLHPQMKQKIKLSKRKGQSWMALREVKGKNEYFDQLTLLAVSLEYGFVRVKIYEAGKISPNLLAFNKHKNTFTKVINVYDEGEKTIIMSQYANDGNLENYVKRLRANALQLKQEHIQFFVYSLFEPIKTVQESTLKSINMLHIKNIFIENGIPKIGEPIPVNGKIFEILADRADVPDFYHSGFKKDPNSRDVIFDTYSLGVLLYKLMYTEYPIFPNGKVHIPTTPSYNKRLKATLEAFLNQGGSLNDLEKKIEVNENVMKQVQENKEKMMEGVPKKEKKVKNVESQEEEQESERPETNSKISLVEEEAQAESEEDDEDEDSCWNTLMTKIKLAPASKLKETHTFLDTLEQSSYRKCRVWTKIILIAILYLFMFFYMFLANFVELLSDRSVLQNVNITISSNNYPVTTSNYYNLDTTFSATTQTIQALQGDGLWCGIDSYLGGPNYSNTVNSESTLWLWYLLTGLFCMIVIVVVKLLQLYFFDEIRALSLRQNGKGKFNVTNFIIFNLMFMTLLAGHFYFYNFIYYSQIDPCFGFKEDVLYGSTYYLFKNESEFLSVYAAVFAAQMIICIVYLCIIGGNQSIPYNKLLNPITIFGGVLFIFILIVRFGAIMNSYYYPSAANDPSGIISGMFARGQLAGVLGVFPELMLLIELAIALIVDWLFYNLLEKSSSLLANDASIANDGLNDLV